MNLRNATSLLLAGALYTVAHKAALGLFPSVAASRVADLAGWLWILAASTLILFAYEFGREVSPPSRWTRYSLVSVMVFTGIIILSELPVWPQVGSMGGRRLAFAIARPLNSAAILVFLVSLAPHIVRGSPLWVPLRACIAAAALMLVVGAASTGYFISFLRTGQEAGVPPFWPFLALVGFAFAYGAAIWFLVRFRHLEDYAGLVKAS